jgi:hypothetical protein
MVPLDVGPGYLISLFFPFRSTHTYALLGLPSYPMWMMWSLSVEERAVSMDIDGSGSLVLDRSLDTGGVSILIQSPWVELIVSSAVVVYRLDI